MTSTDLEALREIDGTIKSSNYLHLELSGEGLAIGWRLECRALREKRIVSNPLSDEAFFLARQIAGGIEEGLAVLAEHDDVPIGLLLAQVNHDAAALEVIDLRIDYDHRRQGLATAMIYQAMQVVREQELRAVLAHTQTNNLPACQLLLKSAFELSGIDTRRHSNHDIVKEAATLIWYAILD